jgi:hypothetical protein
LPLSEGTRAWRVGKEGGWTPSSVPGSFIGRRQTIWLVFDNLDTPRRSSGGPILTDQGLIGMVTNNESLRGFVLPIDLILDFIQENGLPWGLSGTDTVVAAAAPPIPPPQSKTPSEAPGRYPEFSNRVVSPTEIAGLGCLELRIARNEIFARHGYQFRTQDLRQLFSMQPWYHPVSSDVSGELTSTEKKNIEALRAAESGKAC